MFKVGQLVTVNLEAFLGTEGTIDRIDPGSFHGDPLLTLRLTRLGAGLHEMGFRVGKTAYFYERDCIALSYPKESCEPVKYKTSRVSLLVHRDSA